MELKPIEAKHTVIRPFNMEDGPLILKLSQEDSLKNWIPDQVYEDIDECNEVLDYLISQYQDFSSPLERPLVLAVVSKEAGQVIGHVGLSPLKGRVEIGYAIGEESQGKGLGTEVVSAVSQWALEKFSLSVICGVVDSKNKASCRVLEKSGYTFNTEREQMHHGKERMCSIYSYS